jgi:hypothetical protein
MAGPKIKPSEATPEVEAQGCENPHLNPELADRYRVVLTHCRYLENTSLGNIDLTIMTEEQAAQLADEPSEVQPFIERIS